TGLDWNEEVAYDDPKNDSSLMEAANDWVQYVIDRPMAQEPERFSTTAAACRNCWLTSSKRRRGRTLRSTARNICSLPWAWSITGSGRRWEWLIPVDQLAVSRGILEDVPSRERSEQLLLRHHHQALPAEAPGHPHIPLPLHTWKQPPFESILETFLGINKRS